MTIPATVESVKRERPPKPDKTRLGGAELAAAERRYNEWREPAEPVEPEPEPAPSANGDGKAGTSAEPGGNANIAGAPWPDPPEKEAYFGLPGQIVGVIEPESESDPVALLVQILVYVGNLIGRTAHFIVEGTTHFLNEYAVIVGQTSKARKGTSGDRIRGAVGQVDQLWAESRIKSGLSSGEGVIWHCRDSITGRDKEGEIVIKDPGESDKRLLVTESEYATVLRQIERTGNTLSVILRQGWDGSTLSALTSGRQQAPIKATGAHVSIVGHITAEELRRYQTSTEAASGFGNRFLYAAVKRSKCLPRGGRRVDLSPFREPLTNVIDWARRIKDTPLTWDERSGLAWDALYPALSEGKPGLAGALLARGEAHVMRLACIYAVMDLSPSIKAEHLAAALALWEYCERSVNYVFGDSLGDAMADEILRLLRAAPAGMTRTQINEALGRNYASTRIGGALALLMQFGFAIYERQEQERGRPVERWFAVKD